MSYRVVQWGTGNVGFHSLRHIIQHPDLELVGVHAHNPKKQGQDAAILCDLELETGVTATGDVESLIALKPDVVSYTIKGETRPHETVPELAQILSAGIDVVSTAMIFLVHPAHADASVREPLEEACRAGGSTLYVNGIDPGFSGDVLPTTALQLADQVEEVRVQELVDYSTYEDPEFTGVMFGFGRPESYSPPLGFPGVLRAGWGGMVTLLARELGIELDEVEERFDRFFTEKAYDTPMMHVEKGTCAAVRFQLLGYAKGRPVIVTEHVNRLGHETAPDWPSPPVGRPGVHRCVVRGNPSVEIECFVTGGDGDHNSGGVQATAMRVLNAIPAVCDHAPGIIDSFDLPYTPSRNFA